MELKPTHSSPAWRHSWHSLLRAFSRSSDLLNHPCHFRPGLERCCEPGDHLLPLQICHRLKHQRHGVIGSRWKQIVREKSGQGVLPAAHRSPAHTRCTGAITNLSSLSYAASRSNMIWPSQDKGKSRRRPKRLIRLGSMHREPQAPS